MSRGLFECIPNVSEGRDERTTELIGQSIRATSGAYLLHMDSSPSANRTVYTFVGRGPAILNAVRAMMAVITSRIDMRMQEGSHPRIGALDVVPVVALNRDDQDAAVELAYQVGQMLHREYQLPIYYYEQNATAADRRSLAWIRRGGYEGLEERWATIPSEAPDLMPEKYNTRLGATVVGARLFLIAYNVNVATDDLGIVRRMAAAIRSQGRLDRPSRLEAVRAIGWMSPEFGMAQVSTNHMDYRQTNPAQTYAVLQRLAWAYGVSLAGSELVGLIPLDAILASGRYFLPGSDREQELVAAAVKGLGLSSVKAFVPEQHILEYRLGAVKVDGHE